MCELIEKITEGEGIIEINNNTKYIDLPINNEQKIVTCYQKSRIMLYKI